MNWLKSVPMSTQQGRLSTHRDRHFGDTLKYIVLNENVRLSIRFTWSLFLWVYLISIQSRFGSDNSLAPNRLAAITSNNDDQSY